MRMILIPIILTAIAALWWYFRFEVAEWYENNHDRALLSHKQWREKNESKMKLYKKNYYETHKELVKQRKSNGFEIVNGKRVILYKYKK